MPDWLILIASLPATTKTPRMRLWRALKASGAATLRDGVYLLPAGEENGAFFDAQAQEIMASGGTASVLPLDKLPKAEDRAFRGRFDRTKAYKELVQQIDKFRRSLSRAGEGEARRRLAALRREGALLQATDFFPGAARDELDGALTAAEADINASFSPDEPRPANTAITRQDPSKFRGRLWATRRHLWIDRVCSAWLIRRFIDPGARFVWIADPEKCPRNAVGFDFDGATFTHADGRVTFEVLMASFGLEQDAALARIGALVHYLDVGGASVVEAAGLETMMAGLRSTQKSDDGILGVMSAVLDGLYAGYAPSPGSGRKGERGAPRKRRSAG